MLKKEESGEKRNKEGKITVSHIDTGEPVEVSENLVEKIPPSVSSGVNDPNLGARERQRRFGKKGSGKCDFQ